LLDLGSSPNYKDGKGWTAVLVCTTTSIDAHECLEMLLHERAELGTVDATNGWTEVHYVRMHFSFYRILIKGLAEGLL